MAVALGGTPTGAGATSVSSITVSHTASGTDRAVWVGLGSSAGSPPSLSSATYGGTAMTAGYAEITSATFVKQRGFYLAGDGSIPTSAQTVQGNYSATSDEAAIEVISLQGVDSATPVGTAATSTTNTATPSVTVGSVGADDYVVDHIYAADGLNTASSGPGANQTLGAERTVSGFNCYSGSSYQDGADGGVMSWTLSGTPSTGTCLGAIAFKPTAAGGVAAASTLMLMGIGP